LADLIIDGKNLSYHVEIFFTLNLLEEVELHHDHLLLNVLVSLELIIDNVGVDGFGLVSDWISHRYLSQKVKIAG
jgi:hypothetical protein